MTTPYLLYLTAVGGFPLFCVIAQLYLMVTLVDTMEPGTLPVFSGHSSKQCDDHFAAFINPGAPTHS